MIVIQIDYFDVVLGDEWLRKLGSIIIDLNDFLI
jgi:hypothetical protein